MQSSSNQNTHPANTLRVEAWRDLPINKGWATYLVTPKGGETRTVRIRKNNRIILDALRARPVMAASPVRISDNVCILKREYGLNIETRMYSNDTETDRAQYGVYFLLDAVEMVRVSEVAA